MTVELEDGTVLIAECRCQGQVRRVKTMGQYVMNGYPAGEPTCDKVEYECAICRKPMKEAQRG